MKWDLGHELFLDWGVGSGFGEFVIGGGMSAHILGHIDAIAIAFKPHSHPIKCPSRTRPETLAIAFKPHSHPIKCPSRTRPETLEYSPGDHGRSVDYVEGPCESKGQEPDNIG